MHSTPNNTDSLMHQLSLKICLMVCAGLMWIAPCHAATLDVAKSALGVGAPRALLFDAEFFLLFLPLFASRSSGGKLC